MEAPSTAAAAAPARPGSAGTPFANEDGGAAVAPDGRKRYTPDFIKTLRDTHREAPPDLAAGEWQGVPPSELPSAAGGYGAGYDRGGISRK